MTSSIRQSFAPFEFSIPIFIIGAFSGIELRIGGQLYIGEILAAVYLLTNRKEIELKKYIPKSLFWLLCLWPMAQLLSDIVNNITLEDSLKGVGAPIVFLVTWVGFTKYFSNNPRSFPSFLLGLPLGTLISLFLSPSVYFLSSNPWKWGYGPLVTSASLIFYSFFVDKSTSRKFNTTFFFIFVIIALVGLANESRLSLAIVFLYLIWSFFKRSSPRFFRARVDSMGLKIIPIALGISISLVLVVNNIVPLVISSTLLKGILPNEVVEKTEVQSASASGLFLSGRPEIIGSSKAFLDRPLLGHGSWAKDPSYSYYIPIINTLNSNSSEEELQSIYDTLFIIRSDLIPTHSFLLGSIVWAGFVPGLFWLYLIYVLLSVLLRNCFQWPFYYFYTTVFLIWDILFSPFGAYARFSSAIFLAALFAFANMPNNPFDKSIARLPQPCLAAYPSD